MKSFDVDGLLSHLCGLLVGFCLEFLEFGRNAMEKTAGSDIRQTVFFSNTGTGDSWSIANGCKQIYLIIMALSLMQTDFSCQCSSNARDANIIHIDTAYSGRTQVLYKAHVLYCALFSRSCFFFSGNC